MTGTHTPTVRGHMGEEPATVRFMVGDKVKIADDYATGMWLISRNPTKYGPLPHDDAGKDAEVIEAKYSDDGRDRYGLKIEGSERWWYDGYALRVAR